MSRASGSLTTGPRRASVARHDAATRVQPSPARWNVDQFLEWREALPPAVTAELIDGLIHMSVREGTAEAGRLAAETMLPAPLPPRSLSDENDPLPLAELWEADRFLEWYAVLNPSIKAELIDGRIYMNAAAVRADQHGEPH